jgi:hypothetical protein
VPNPPLPPQGRAELSRGHLLGATKQRGLLCHLLSTPDSSGGHPLPQVLCSCVDRVLSEELYAFTGKGWEQEDDITLLTLQRSATRS